MPLIESLILYLNSATGLKVCIEFCVISLPTSQDRITTTGLHSKAQIVDVGRKQITHSAF